MSTIVDPDPLPKEGTESNLNKSEKVSEKKKGSAKEKKTLFNFRWAIHIFCISFGISVVLSVVSESATNYLNVVASSIVLLLFIVLNVLFDTIGLSIATADPSIFNSMAAKNVSGSRAALWFLSKSDVMSNFCNDMIGDISGVLCGAMGSVIASTLSSVFHWNMFVVTVIVSAIISALIVGGKALFKTVALKKSNEIVFGFSKFVCFFLTEKPFKKKKSR